ncbi:UDP-N-acetylmuramate dehydrogenase [Gudongella oleilytica]|jgi:UDP-N-acetylmuramate dehydrogenase|uniref:UDP-N-acetylmuramate dehydrogenase n=1 Tax=Gudongella oleilytica TaxID=1582259 RepID=UPI002A36F385|nr:UDP-N-acetylmuramate dehydrogenase [Gudongella oleilytica]MDY0256437.1 UDP-N-acetylmuramate dehydrogenase [Gudongella oleilytica]
MNKYMKLFDEQDFVDIRFDEPMSAHTSFKIGGPADVLIRITSEEEMEKALRVSRERNVPLFIMGNGSNLLVKDGGIRGVVLKINDGFDHVRIDDDTIYAQAGALLTAVSKAALRESLEGLEFASGIPGTIGGAISMNAGAYGGEMKDVVTLVRAIDKYGRKLQLSGHEMEFAYRNSRVKRDDLIVLDVAIKLKKGDYTKIDGKMKELTVQRTSKQPLEMPSAGSTFKRPEGYFAGKLIEDSGLRGLRHGDAQVSEKHCGFVVNRGKSTCKEVLELIEVVRKTVRDKFEVELEMEIKLAGED